MKEEISTGEAVAGMIINGLGFSDRPMTLTPQFFQSKAMEAMFRKGVTPDIPHSATHSGTRLI